MSHRIGSGSKAPANGTPAANALGGLPVELNAPAELGYATSGARETVVDGAKPVAYDMPAPARVNFGDGAMMDPLNGGRRK